MKTLMKFRNVFLLIASMFLLTSCSSMILLGDDTLQSIESIGDFFKVYLMLQLSILICSLILSFFLGDLGGIISLIAHFIWVVSERDYGLFMVLLLFGFSSIVMILIKFAVLYFKSK